MNDLSNLLDGLREHTQSLHENGVRRVEFDDAGRTLLAGAGFALVLAPEGVDAMPELLGGGCTGGR